MSLRFHSLTALSLCLALGSLAACHSGRRSPTDPSSPFAGSFGAPAPFGFEPATLRAELVNGTSCVSFRPFSTRIIIVVSPDSDVILRSLHFRFTDRFGVTALPTVSSNLTSGPIPPLGVAPLPTTTSVQIPTSSPIPGMMVPGGSSQRLPFLLTFGCGVSDTGLLIVSVDSADMRGRLQTSQLQVRVTQ